ncbi:MAG: hypothetical protein ACOY4K_01350 [Pseudomonadota bacterium]
MTPVRPPVWPNVPPPANGAGAAKSAARGAFFQAAMGQASTPAAPAEPVRAAPRVVRDIPAEPPTKVLRPGSLLDIRV